MALVGVSALIFRERREQGPRLVADIPTLDRDLVFFLVLFAVGIAAPGWCCPTGSRIPLAVVFVCAYFVYVRLTLRGGGEVQEAETIGPPLHGPRRADEPTNG